MKQHIIYVIICLMGISFSSAFSQTLPQMRISVENSENHVHTKSVKIFADTLKTKVMGKIDVRFFSDARLFRDSDVIRAMVQGKVEMAVPGTWHVTQFEPDAGIFLLPFFYGQPVETNYNVLDSIVGRTLNENIEKNLKLKVVGRWIDLGHAHIFGINRKISRHEDIDGLKVRVAGGVANKLRIEAFGGISTIIPWPDLPEYMKLGKVDAVLTTYETIRSAKLWEKGIKSVFEDNEYFPQYIPLVRLSFWQKLSPDIQQIIVDTWEENVNVSRKASADAQQKAKEQLIENGVEVVVPDEDQLRIWRKKLISMQNDFISEVGIDHELVMQLNSIPEL
ncbi:TRAP dicarboxylate transporter-DctP subunit (fragment) [Desulfamplus magnetovallimortis]|uniref:TRAP dicarboxylate transporter-DctP subunit n=1 Tax=Desulfamplus magnetovallimortis TaxID=1246637 RepID=A0A1W1H6M0_9BACT